MNEFRFNHLQNRSRLKLPRPILYVGVAIILLAFFSIKTFQRAGESDPGAPAPLEPPVAEAPAVLPAAEPVEAPAAALAEIPTGPALPPAPDATEQEDAGILALDGEGARIKPPRRIGGRRPEIPQALLTGQQLDHPRVYVRVGKDGRVTDVKLISSSGNDQVDRLVLDALQAYTFHPATTAGRPVEFSSVVTVPLSPADEAAPHSNSSESISEGSR